MFSFLGRTNKGKLVFVAEIESGSAAVALVLLQNSKPAQVITSERAFLPLEERTPEQMVTSSLDLFSGTAARVLKAFVEGEGGKKYGSPSSVHVIVGAPWVHSRTARAEESYNEEKTVTETVIKDLAKRALQEPSTLDGARVFETSVTRVQLNGYSTGKPIGKRAHHAMVTVLESDIDMAVKSGVEHTLGQLLPGRSVDFRSTTRVALTVLHQRARSHHYLFLMMGATNTECVAVHKEDTNEHAVVPLGTGSIARRLAGEEGLPEGVFSLMRMLMSDAGSTPASESLKTNLAKTEPELVKAFGDMFASVATRRRIPNTCFLAAHVDFAPWLEHFLSRIDFAQFTVTAQPLSIELLTPEHVRDQVVWAGAPEDTGLALAAAFVNSVQHSP